MAGGGRREEWSARLSPSASRLSPLPAVNVLPLFPALREELLALLTDLTPEDWLTPTVCTGWSVKDVAAHLLGDDIGRLSWGRDGYVSPSFAAGLDISTLTGFIAAIDRQNAVWVEATRRVSPQLLIALLRSSGEMT